MYKQPKIGDQTVQAYHPDRGINYQHQVSTYGANGWIISFCSTSDINSVKLRDKALSIKESS